MQEQVGQERQRSPFAPAPLQSLRHYYGLATHDAHAAAAAMSATRRRLETRDPASSARTVLRTRMQREMIRLIGIDPGLRRTGWGIIESDGVRLVYVASGMIEPDTDAVLAQRLAAIFRGLNDVLATHAPAEAAVEETFVNENAKATLKLGQARGIAMLAPAMKGLRVAEYTPNLIKKTVVGAGHADKRQIQMMVGMLLPKAKFDSADEADALAIAICHANHRTSAQARALAQMKA
jgi:crossover junction endodeoxyribonuclease RuvC